MTIGTKLAALFCYRPVGRDSNGNKYYLSRRKNAEGKYKRMVMYNGIAEASKIPPMWHAWLHYALDEFPSQSELYNWQEKRIANFTGTNLAYSPLGTYKQRPMVASDYEAWNPNN
jgi:NADH:ubiquinone oxidoreductase subunit